MFISLFLSIVIVVDLVVSEQKCTMAGKRITCTNVIPSDISTNLTVDLIDHTDVVHLNVSNSYISHIHRTTFGNYPQLDALYVSNSELNQIDADAFHDLIRLRKLHLNDNYLETFNSNTFLKNNFLKELDLSNNLIRNLDNFNVSTFSKLTLLDVSNNRLNYLPKEILKRVKEKNKFYIIVDNNPWNCSDENWIDELNDILIDSFCTNNTYEETNKTMFELSHKSDNRSEINLMKCNVTKVISGQFYGCIFWIFGGLWLGILLGNVGYIKRILCPKKVPNHKGTQCEHPSFRISIPRSAEVPLIAVKLTDKIETVPGSETVG